MRSLVALEFGPPSGYTIVEKEDLQIGNSTDVLIKIHGASINGHDVIMASGKTKMIQTLPLPYPIGLDFAGIIMAVGKDVTDFKEGDNVYGFNAAGGAASTHLLLDIAKPHALSKIPDGLSMVQAASLPGVALTALISLERANDYFKSEGGLKDKTVLIPGALAGVGSIALQIAKRHWGCRTLTAASTAKIPQLAKYLGDDVVDQVYDYTKVDLVKEIGKGAVDFVFDTTGLASEYLPLIKKGGYCLSIARLPPGSALKDDGPDALPQPRVACIGQGVMDGIDAVFKTWAKAVYGVTYVYQKTEPTSPDIMRLNELVASGKVKAVVGNATNLDNIDQIRKACTAILAGKGGIGKFVIEMARDES